MEKGRVVILAAGTGNPYFTTDTAAALRALELNADILLMAKNGIDGVYDSDPRINPGARRYERLSHQEAIEKDLRVMDAAALSLCKENGTPVVVMSLEQPDAVGRVVRGERLGTLVHP